MANINNIIKKTEFMLARLKAVQEQFPNVRVYNNYTFSDKKVNQIYTNFKFETSYGRLYAIPYCEVYFTFDGKEETAQVFSSPRKNYLAKISWRLDPQTKKKTISFSRFVENMKNHHFKDEIFHACKAEILNFIKNYPNYILDTKHLDPRLKKLLAFS